MPLKDFDYNFTSCTNKVKKTMLLMSFLTDNCEFIHFTTWLGIKNNEK